MALVVPTLAVPSQTFEVTLGGQDCQLDVYQRSTGLYINVATPPGTLVIGGVICRNLNRIVRSLYLGFIGDLAFVDMQGTDDPQYLGLGSRWFLLYLSPAELPPLPP